MAFIMYRGTQNPFFKSILAGVSRNNIEAMTDWDSITNPFKIKFNSSDDWTMTPYMFATDPIQSQPEDFTTMPFIYPYSDLIESPLSRTQMSYIACTNPYYTSWTDLDDIDVLYVKQSDRSSIGSSALRSKYRLFNFSNNETQGYWQAVGSINSEGETVSQLLARKPAEDYFVFYANNDSSVISGRLQGTQTFNYRYNPVFCVNVNKVESAIGEVDGNRNIFLPLSSFIVPMSRKNYSDSYTIKSLNKHYIEAFDWGDNEPPIYCWPADYPSQTSVAFSLTIIHKKTLAYLMNLVGKPWTMTSSDAQKSVEDIIANNELYDPAPKLPGTGQDDNTSSDWTGAGDNSEDSFEFTTPNFSPFGSTVNQYAMSGLQVQQFIRELFEGSFITNPDLIKNDPKEGLVSCRYYPFNVRFHDPDGIGNQEEIVVGGVQMEYSAGAKILPNYNQILDIGEFKFDEYFGGFLDYQLTTVDIYLPYVGWQQMPATSLMGRTLKIKYVVDIISGDCSCLLTTTDGKIERFENVFSGHMGIDIPILTSNHNENTKQAASSVLSAVTAVGGAVATYATGGIGGIAAAGISAAAITNSATDIATMQNHANMGTPISSSTSLWMPQDIIFRITRPRKSEASEFKNRRGYRSNYSTQLKNVTGFVQIDDPFLDGLSLHEGEKEQLAQILKGGIFI